MVNRTINRHIASATSVDFFHEESKSIGQINEYPHVLKLL